MGVPSGREDMARTVLLTLSGPTEILGNLELQEMLGVPKILLLGSPNMTPVRFGVGKRGGTQ
jgi:hypothetical protein